MDTAIVERTDHPNHLVATREEWLAARKALLEREKALTRLGDAVAPSAALCRGCGWRRTTSSTRRRARGRSPTCSTAAISW